MKLTRQPKRSGRGIFIQENFHIDPILCACVCILHSALCLLQADAVPVSSVSLCQGVLSKGMFREGPYSADQSAGTDTSLSASGAANMSFQQANSPGLTATTQASQIKKFVAVGAATLGTSHILQDRGNESRDRSEVWSAEFSALDDILASMSGTTSNVYWAHCANFGKFW
jgi:hypothetical protein